MPNISAAEILLILLNIALGSFAIMAAMGIILITKAQLAKSWFLVGVAVFFFVVKEICGLLTTLGAYNAGALKGLAEFLFIFTLTISVFYQYKIIRDISKKVK